MNFSIIIKLLLMHTVHARLGWSSIESIGTSSLVKDSGLVINPDGPLHPLRGYILHKSGHMYNKRLYAPEINTEYGLKKLNKKAVNSAYSYKYTRTPVNDKAYTDICGNRAKNKYLIRLHTQIIRMFPSADGALSIVAGRPDALTSFLIKDEVQPESMYILAAIFLLSEQVNVPIIVNLEEKENERLVLKSKDGKITYVDQSLVLNTNPRKIEKGRNNWHTETVGLINFLKDHMQGKLAQMQKKEGYIEPTTYEQFMTGNFLNTPQFLAQSYIYEFIDTKDKYIEFVEAVYTLLEDQIMNKSTPKKKRDFYGKVLNICFIQKGAPSDSINHTAMISDLKKTVNAHKTFPFNSPAEIPEYTRVKAYSRENDEFIDNEEKKYSNCVEAALLGLFCCLLYDPEMREYTTHHIPNKKEAAALKVFFQKYNEPAEAADYKMQQEWCRVVAGLNNKNIQYKKEKNEIRSGWINILYVIAEVVGYSPEVLQAIKYMENIRNAKGQSSTLEMQEILTDMFKFLSQNKNVRAECSSNLVLGPRSDKKPDLFGKIKLIYAFNKKDNEILIDINPGHARLHLVNESIDNKCDRLIKGKLRKIERAYKYSKRYTECIVRNYINIEQSNIEIKYTSISKECTMVKQIHESIEKNHNGILGLLLHGPIIFSGHKTYIVMHFLILYAKDPIPADSALARFTANIIGSVPLDDLETRMHMLLWLVYNRNAKEYYPRIKDCWEEVYTLNKYKFNILIGNLFTSSKYPHDVVLECFYELMRVAGASKTIHDVTGVYGIVENILKFSCRSKQPIKAFSEILDTMEEAVIRKGKNVLVYFYFDWLCIMMSTDLKSHVGFTRLLFHRLDSSAVLSKSGKWKTGIDAVSLALEHFKNNKDILCNENSPESVEKYNRIINKIAEIIRLHKRGHLQRVLDYIRYSRLFRLY